MTIQIKKCRVCKVAESGDYDTCQDCHFRATFDNRKEVEKQTELEKENVQ